MFSRPGGAGLSGRFTKGAAVEFVLATAAIGFSAFILLMLLIPRENYASVDIDDIGTMSPRFVLYGSETYMVFRLSGSLNTAASATPPRDRRVEYDGTVDPPRHNEQIGPYRVFALHEYRRMTMLPAKKWWEMKVPCSGLEVVQDAFEYNGKILVGGIVCRRSISPWWPGEARVVYDLNGYSQTKSLANLYVPIYHLHDGEIHIGAHHRH